jgi:hypothetical protein
MQQPIGAGEPFSGRNMCTVNVEEGDRRLGGKRFKDVSVHEFKRGVDIAFCILSKTKLKDLYQKV